ncbi:hypothetical protein [Microlunatus endophyticus]|uniref:hypothetical protein n=1 Tax=Microlunatus endophyticus TaxID=1716077 RepID=UPI001667EEC5|nr:hypothetical protein [Microlunatus endophyticus]
MPATGLVDDLVRSVSGERGRPIHVVEEDLGPNEPSGLWVAGEGVDLIVIPTSIGSSQRTAIICHELAHILLGHVPIGADSDLDGLVDLVAPHVDAAVAKQMLGRFSYADDLEAEAEAFGTILVTKLADRTRRLRLKGDSVSDRLR